MLTQVESYRVRRESDGPPSRGWGGRLIGLDALERLAWTLRGQAAGGVAEAVLASLQAGWVSDPADLARIPRAGPLVVVSNHPHGMLDGLVLAAALRAVRPEVRVLANGWLRRYPVLDAILFPAELDGERGAVSANARVLLRAVRFVRDGGALVVFPAGQVARWRTGRGRVEDAAWSPDASRIARLGDAAVMPAYLSGANSLWFQTLGQVHRRVRLSMLPRELLRAGRTSVRVALGEAVPAPRSAASKTDESFTAYLRCRTERLRPAAQIDAAPRRMVPVAEPTDAATLSRAVGALDPSCELLRSGDLRVLVTPPPHDPTILREIGRLREVTFRGVGEGTGRGLDVDRFDARYHQLFVWDQRAGVIVGGYRLGLVDVLTAHGGRGALYTRTLFRYRRGFFADLGPTVELGRSFVRPEYQRSFTPLLLWQGIGRFIAARPWYRHLLGPASICATYTQLSRRVIVEHLRRCRLDERLAPRARARNPPRFSRSAPWEREASDTVSGCTDLTDAFVRDLEGDKGIPILIRQYLKLGARAIAFNVDHGFGDALDVLLVVDLLGVPEPMLSRYMGREAGAAYRAAHGV